MPQTGTELARFPLFLLDQFVSMGWNRDRLLRESGLTRQELRDPDARLQASKSTALWRVVLDEDEDPGLGVRVGSALRARDVGLVGFTMMHSPTLGEALQRLVRFGRILYNAGQRQIRESAHRVEVSFEPIPEQRLELRRMADFDLAAMLAVARELTGIEVVPEEVWFPYPEPSIDLATHRAHFGSKLAFDKARLGLVFKARTLALPVRTADAELGRYLDELAESVIETLVSSGSFGESVERTLWNEIKTGRPQLNRVAAALALSPRTLQRRLREEGTTFAEILDRFRHQMSTILLDDRELAIYEIAYLLGYSEPSTFYRAFRRWTGASPREYRSAGTPRG